MEGGNTGEEGWGGGNGGSARANHHCPNGPPPERPTSHRQVIRFSTGLILSHGIDQASLAQKIRLSKKVGRLKKVKALSEKA